MARDILEWMITGRCNYRCRHCYLGELNGYEPSGDELLSLIPKMKKAGIKRVSITGGEPLTRPDFYKITDALSKQDIDIISINTNGSLLNEEVLLYFKELGQKPVFNISYDGDGSHDYIRNKADATELTLGAFDLCQEHGFSTGCEMMVHANNLNRLSDTVKTLEQHGCGELNVLPVFMVGKAGEDGAFERIEPKALLEAFCDCITDYYEFGCSMKLTLYGFFLAEGSKGVWVIPVELFAKDDTPLGMCQRSIPTPFLDSAGRVLPCAGIAGFPGIAKDFPSVYGDSFDKAFSSEGFLDFMEYSIDIHSENNDNCAGCKYLKACTGGCRIVAMSEGEGFYGKDKYVCEYFKGGWKEKVVEAVKLGRFRALLSGRE